MGIQEPGVPGYPPITQWVGENIAAIRLRKGRHLLYRDATSPGQSGSPLYYIDEDKKKAFVVATHVGGNRIIGNSAVPISNHMKTFKTWTDQPTSSGKLTLSTYILL